MNLCTGRQRGKNVAIKAGSCRGSEAENKAWWGGGGRAQSRVAGQAARARRLKNPRAISSQSPPMRGPGARGGGATGKLSARRKHADPHARRRLGHDPAPAQPACASPGASP